MRREEGHAREAPSQLSDEESQALGLDYRVGFALTKTGRLAGDWAAFATNSAEPNLYLDAEGNVQASVVPRGYTEFLIDVAGYGLYALPEPKGS